MKDGRRQEINNHQYISPRGKIQDLERGNKEMKDRKIKRGKKVVFYGNSSSLMTSAFDCSRKNVSSEILYM